MPEPKIIFCVISCHRRTYESEATHSTHVSGENTQTDWIRKVWFDAAQVDKKIFFGRGAEREPLPDEVFLDVGDDYYSLVPKVRAVIRWARDAGYDWMWKIDTDVYVDVPKTLANFQPVDYLGNMRDGQVKRFGEEPELTVRYGCGPAYQLSRRAMEVIINSEQPATPYEDRATGFVLAQAGIPLTESTELMTCLCKDCLAQPGNYAQFHVETPEWRELFLKKYGKI